MNVDDIMTKNPECVEETCTVKEALDKFVEFDIRHLPVVSKGKLVGIVSDRDVRSYLLPLSEEIRDYSKAEERFSHTIRSVMQSDLITVTPDTDVGEVIDLMIDHKVGAVPVVDEAEDRALCGIVSYIDVLQACRELI